MDPQTIALTLAALVALLLKASGLPITTNRFFLFVVSAILAVLALLVTGGLALPPTTDPIAFLGALGTIVSAVYTLAAVVYAFLGDQLATKVFKVKLAK